MYGPEYGYNWWLWLHLYGCHAEFAIPSGIRVTVLIRPQEDMPTP